MGRVRLDNVEVTEEDIAKIPHTNLRVPRTEFAAVWGAAERLCDEQGRRKDNGDWYAAGVAVTCEWLARATVRSPTGRPYLVTSPVTGRAAPAYEELIEVELVEAEKLDMRQPRPEWLKHRPGWSEAICATLRWAWARSSPPPLRLGKSAAS